MRPGAWPTLDEGGKVPEAQLPEMDYDPAGSAEKVQQALNSHASNKQNPHGVTAKQAGADPAGTASSSVSSHNQDEEAHADIREDITDLMKFKNGIGNEYIWAKSEEYAQTGALSSEVKVADIYSSSSFQYSNEVQVSGGVITLKNPTTAKWNTKPSSLTGKYFTSAYESGIYYGAAGSWASGSDGVGTFPAYPISAGIRVVEYLNDRDPSAYPPSQSDGYIYSALGQLGSKVQIEIGSYIGTGKYGKTNPLSITTEFAADVIIMIATSATEANIPNVFTCYNAYCPVIMSKVGADWTRGIGFKLGESYITNTWSKKSSDGRTLHWYGNNLSDCANDSGRTYHFMAIKFE